MESDDLLPNDGTYFLPREPKEQEVDRKKERAKTLEAQAVLRTVVTRLEEQIACYDSVSAIPQNVRTNPEAFLITVNANQLVRDVLTSEKEYIEQLLDNAGVSGLK